MLDVRGNPNMESKLENISTNIASSILGGSKFLGCFGPSYLRTPIWCNMAYVKTQSIDKPAKKKQVKIITKC